MSDLTLNTLLLKPPAPGILLFKNNALSHFGEMPTVWYPLSKTNCRFLTRKDTKSQDPFSFYNIFKVLFFPTVPQKLKTNEVSTMENRGIMFRVWALSTAYSENSTWACNFCSRESMRKEWQALNNEHTHKHNISSAQKCIYYCWWVLVIAQRYFSRHL